jgi:hypothetical protein
MGTTAPGLRTSQLTAATYTIEVANGITCAYRQLGAARHGQYPVEFALVVNEFLAAD